MVREVILVYDKIMEERALLPWESQLRRSLKFKVLGLASLMRSIARQKSRTLFLKEGDANTKFFHLQACHRGRQNRIEALQVDGAVVSDPQALHVAAFNFFNSLLGTDFVRTRRLDLHALGIPTLPLHDLDVEFTVDEVWETIKDMPNDKAPGPDGFTTLFYKVAWPIIKHDVMQAFNAFWSLDARSFHHLNDAYMVLLKKKCDATQLREFRPISLIHSFGKIVTKCLARRLAPQLHDLILRNQSAFIRGRSIHDNVRNVQLTCKAIHMRKSPCVFLKIDIAKAFDLVA